MMVKIVQVSAGIAASAAMVRWLPRGIDAIKAVRILEAIDTGSIVSGSSTTAPPAEDLD